MIEDLLRNMTLEEKIGQMMQLMSIFFGSQGEITGPVENLGIEESDIWQCGSVLGVTTAADMRQIQEQYLEKSTHKIPLLFMLDVIHGFRTIFPIPLAIGCSFQPEKARRMAEISGKEAALSGVQVTFAPMADLVRDPRWGRVMESTGEDGWLNGLFAQAMVKGYQENREERYRISACIKHIAGYGAVEGGREYNTTDMSDWMLREYYLPAYKMAVEAGCDMAMSSFNLINGIPATGNPYLLKRILREEWGFNGVVISDWGAVGELIVHGVAKDGNEAACLAGNAGVDIEMMTANYVRFLTELVEEGQIEEADIDRGVLRILQLKEKRGLFTNPLGAADEEQAEKICGCQEHRNEARDLAADSMVLLKNDNAILPLSRSAKIALIGPFVDEKKILGNWRVLGREEETVSLREGIAEKIGEDHLFCTINHVEMDYDQMDYAETIKTIISKADIVILAVGEEQDMTGEAASRSDLRLPGRQEELVDLAASYGKPVILVLFNGRPLVLTKIADQADAILEAWFPGTEGGHAVADILFGDKEPSGRLTMSFPAATGQIPVYYNHFSTGRPQLDERKELVSCYQDISNAALYPFGYGLTYTEFTYGEVKADRETWYAGDVCNVSVMIKNCGKRKGTETVQLYLQDLKGCVVRPVKELKGFQRIALMPGEEKMVSFMLTENMLFFHNSRGDYIIEAGQYRIMIGADSSVSEGVLINYIM